MYTCQQAFLKLYDAQSCADISSLFNFENYSLLWFCFDLFGFFDTRMFVPRSQGPLVLVTSVILVLLELRNDALALEQNAFPSDYLGSRHETDECTYVPSVNDADGKERELKSLLRKKQKEHYTRGGMSRRWRRKILRNFKRLSKLSFALGVNDKLLSANKLPVYRKPGGGIVRLMGRQQRSNCLEQLKPKCTTNPLTFPSTFCQVDCQACMGCTIGLQRIFVLEKKRGRCSSNWKENWKLMAYSFNPPIASMCRCHG